ncbi:MAG: PilZ domain-containing protein [Deltaproteobacteria bacterium]|nr:PilZ domain-containing protein [Deltaproteobacteria bacterium]
MNPTDRRTKPRNEVRWRVTIETVQGTIEGETRNVSVEGLFVCCDEPLRLQESYRIAILPPGRPAIGVKGKVVWSDVYGMDNDSVFGMGVCLVEVSEKDRQFLEETFSRLSPD